MQHKFSRYVILKFSCKQIWIYIHYPVNTHQPFPVSVKEHNVQHRKEVRKKRQKKLKTLFKKNKRIQLNAFFHTFATFKSVLLYHLDTLLQTFYMHPLSFKPEELIESIQLSSIFPPSSQLIHCSFCYLKFIHSLNMAKVSQCTFLFIVGIYLIHIHLSPYSYQHFLDNLFLLNST